MVERWHDAATEILHKRDFLRTTRIGDRAKFRSMADWSRSERSDRFGTTRREVDAEIARIASRQKQLITIDQLGPAGLGARGAQKRAARAVLHRVHRGVYAAHPPPYSRHQRWLAAVYRAGPGSMLSDLPAAGLLRILEDPPLVAHVSNATGAARGAPGIVVHRRLIDPRDRTVRFGIPCTTAARTIIDCARGLDGEALEDLVMAADSIHVLDRDRFEVLVREHRGQPGTAALAALITDDPIEARSRNERRLFSICREFGVELPLVNLRIDVEGGRHFYADFCWPRLRLIVEAQSWRWHGGRQATEDDADRAQLLAIAGWNVVEFTRDQIKKRRPETGRRLVALTR